MNTDRYVRKEVRKIRKRKNLRGTQINKGTKCLCSTIHTWIKCIWVMVLETCSLTITINWIWTNKIVAQKCIQASLIRKCYQIEKVIMIWWVCLNNTGHHNNIVVEVKEVLMGWFQCLWFSQVIWCNNTLLIMVKWCHMDMDNLLNKCRHFCQAQCFLVNQFLT
jgi:hypothetical protein